MVGLSFGSLGHQSEGLRLSDLSMVISCRLTLISPAHSSSLTQPQYSHPVLHSSAIHKLFVFSFFIFVVISHHFGPCAVQIFWSSSTTELYFTYLYRRHPSIHQPSISGLGIVSQICHKKRPDQGPSRVWAVLDKPRSGLGRQHQSASPVSRGLQARLHPHPPLPGTLACTAPRPPWQTSSWAVISPAAFPAAWGRVQFNISTAAHPRFLQHRCSSFS